MRRATALLALLAALSTTALGTAAPAGADGGGYRYWSFWEQTDDGSWTYATRGPSTQRPGDGDALGFRFALSTGDKDAARPRPDAAFADVCEGGKPAPGTKRVALSIDFGTAAHAPEGERPPKPRTACATVDEDATAAEALAETAELRYDSGSMLCAVAAYPRSGCGEQVSGKEDTGEPGSGETTAGQESGLPAGIATGAGAAVVAALAVAGVRKARRRG